MDWTDDGIVLSARPYGETSIILTLLTVEHGRHLGLVRGGRSRRMRGVLQATNEVTATWRARLADHLGNYTVELRRSRAATYLDHRAALAGVAAVCAVLDRALPEREPHPVIYDALRSVLDVIEFHAGEENGIQVWGPALVRFELGLLQELGFGLDLTHCAATGATENLIYVSPRSGRAVSAEAGHGWRERLLKLPSFLTPEGAKEATIQDVADGIELAGYFLDHHVFRPHRRDAQREDESALPPARLRLPDVVREPTRETGSAI